MSFSVLILGSGAAIPTGQRNPTAQYVECNDRHILLDCGEGTQNQLRRYGVKIQKISHILISHLHGDHFFGLVGLLSTMHLLGRTKGITVYGPAGLEEIIKMQLEIGGARLDFSLDFVSLTGTEAKTLFEDRMIEITTFPLKHRIPANGFRINEKQKDRSLNGEKFREDGLSLTLIGRLKAGQDIELEDGTMIYADEYTYPAPRLRSYAYCSDTVYLKSVVPHISGVSLLYHEGTFLNALSDRAKATFHSTAEDAAKIAKLADVKKLLIGHISARYLSNEGHLAEASAVFENVVVVNDGDKFDV
jgi:ribonuclease Z